MEKPIDDKKKKKYQKYSIQSKKSNIFYYYYFKNENFNEFFKFIEIHLVLDCIRLIVRIIKKFMKNTKFTMKSFEKQIMMKRVSDRNNITYISFG